MIICFRLDKQYQLLISHGLGELQPSEQGHLQPMQCPLLQIMEIQFVDFVHYT